MYYRRGTQAKLITFKSVVSYEITFLSASSFASQNTLHIRPVNIFCSGMTNLHSCYETACRGFQILSRCHQSRHQIRRAYSPTRFSTQVIEKFKHLKIISSVTREYDKFKYEATSEQKKKTFKDSRV
jgi:hypothetical protein